MKPSNTQPISMPVSDVAEWDDDERLRRYTSAWPMSGRSEAEVMEAAAKLKVKQRRRPPRRGA